MALLRESKFSSTGTIYDLAHVDIETADEETKEYLKEIKKKGDVKRGPLLSKEDIESSFASIKDKISDEEGVKEKVDDEEFEKILEEQKSALADVVKEYNELVKSTPSKEEINRESEKEFVFLAEKKNKRNQKKQIKDEKRKNKEEMKERKKLMKLQPKGTTITYDDVKGIEIHAPEFTEMKTLTTSDPTEDKK